MKLFTSLESSSIELNREELLDDINNISETINADTDNTYRSCCVLESLIDLAITLESTSELTVKDKALIKVACEMAVAGTATNSKAVLPALENYNDSSIALEGIMDVVKDGFSNVTQNIGGIIKKELDILEYMFTFYEAQYGDLQDLRQAIKDKSFTKATAEVKDSKYLRYGLNGDLVTSGQDYMKRYHETMNTMEVFNREIERFQRDDFMASVKTLVSPITGYDEQFMKMYDNLNTLVLNVKKGCKLHKSGYSFGADVFKSDMLLGLSYIECTDTPLSIEDRSKFQNVKDSLGKMSMSVVRYDKFTINMFKDWVELEGFTKHDLLSLIDISMKNIDSYKGMMDLKNKLSSLGGGSMLSGLVLGNILPSPGVVPGAWAHVVSFVTTGFSGKTTGLAIFMLAKLVLANYRALLISSHVIYNCNASGFNFARGNIDCCKNVIKKALK
jgi:hypothetical protein